MGTLHRSNKFYIVVLGGVLLVSAALVFFLGRVPGRVVSIFQNGELVRRIDLSGVVEPYSFTVECEDGINVISVENGRIRVSEADCPDGTCVRQGWMSSGAVPIVCLPHKLVIKLGESGYEEVDAVAGG